MTIHQAVSAMISLRGFVLCFVLISSPNELWGLVDKNELLHSSQEIIEVNGYFGPKPPPVAEICYQPLGCFHKNGTFKHLKWLPEPPTRIGTKFALYTRQNPDIPVYLSYEDPESLKNRYFNPNRKTKIVCHGFTQSMQSKYIIEIKEAIMQVEDANIIIVDWKNGAALPFYLSAAVNTEVVGRQVALLISLLMANIGLNEKDVHIIGFSLGSHLAGFAGKRLRDTIGVKVGRITGLDPAAPMFEGSDESVHLAWKDADYVDVIHTSAGDSYFSGDLGMITPVGHADFYPNGGKSQPGCDKLVCSHRRAMELFINSILNPCEFRAYPCDEGYDEFQNGKCFSCEKGCNRMGYHSQLDHNERRKFYLLTRESHPFCGVAVKVTVRSSSEQKTTYGQVDVALVGEDLLEDTIVLTKSTDHIIDAGTTVKGMVIAHESVFPLKEVKITYRKYKGWFTDGNHEWNIDDVTIADETGNIKFQYCSRNTTLISEETMVLYQKEC